MPKNNKWTYSPKYTEARIANELAFKEQHMTSTLTELLRASSQGKDVKTIVFERFIQMLGDFELGRDVLSDLGPEDWVVDFNQHTFEWFLDFVQEELSDEEPKREDDDPMSDYELAKEFAE